MEAGCEHQRPHRSGGDQQELLVQICLASRFADRE
jgi:hypothetical protein